MSKMTGKLKKIIYSNDENGYLVALFRVKKSDVLDTENKTINVTGNFYDIKIDALMEIEGEYVLNSKYNKMQFNIKTHNYLKPDSEEAIIEFLSSPFIEGCGKSTAEKLVKIYGEKTIDKVKENINNLYVIPTMNEVKANKIYNSLLNYDKSDKLILEMQNMGFSIEDASKIINKYKDNTENILNKHFYLLKELIDFKKLDNIYLQAHDKEEPDRIYACTLEAIREASFEFGNTYLSIEELDNGIKNYFNLNLNTEIIKDTLTNLVENHEIIIEESKIYLMELYQAEKDVAHYLHELTENSVHPIKKFDEKIAKLQEQLNINYDETQLKAIKSALNSNVSIICGGPGTGKTTIINAIVKLFITDHFLSPIDVQETIALLAPTGRASKKMNQSTGLPASTIHRFLKWHKETDEFLFNEMNKVMQKFIIVDEASMIDINLFASLLKALPKDAKLILVGDSFQLPSVGPGLVLNDLITSDLFTYIPLTQIYRQSDNSYIPYLAKDIKDCDLQEEFLNKKDDYNFIRTDSDGTINAIKEIVMMALKKGIDESSMQVLSPVYRGINGIDNLNSVLQNIFNPPRKNRDEIHFGDVIFREGDKVLQLLNDPDNNVYNGDIGFITSITKLEKPHHQDIITVLFDTNEVEYHRKDLINLKHAYAISVHKSQGSEFDHVVMPICKDFFYMLYNKLIYTGVSRAKKSLILVGDPSVFNRGVMNNYSDTRNTTLKMRLNESFITYKK
jgi:exodeoxyribonuclease V alpha subunit